MALLLAVLLGAGSPAAAFERFGTPTANGAPGQELALAERWNRPVLQPASDRDGNGDGAPDEPAARPSELAGLAMARGRTPGALAGSTRPSQGGAGAYRSRAPPRA